MTALPDDVITFVEARLAEDEQWALAASAPDSWRGNHPPIPTGVRWTWAVGDNWEPYRVDPLEEHIGDSVGDYAPTLITVDEWPYDRSTAGRTHFHHKVLSGEEVRSFDGGHIVRHDPARVLRAVEAGRELVAAYRGAGEFYDAHTAAPAGEMTGLWTALRLLASHWADHRDYDPDWAV